MRLRLVDGGWRGRVVAEVEMPKHRVGLGCVLDAFVRAAPGDAAFARRPALLAVLSPGNVEVLVAQSEQLQAVLAAVPDDGRLDCRIEALSAIAEHGRVPSAPGDTLASLPAPAPLSLRAGPSAAAATRTKRRRLGAGEGGKEATLATAACRLCGECGHGQRGEGRICQFGHFRRRREGGLEPIFIHEYCCILAPRVYYDRRRGRYCGVGETLRSPQCRRMVCPLCGRRGTTIGCPVAGCDDSYHLECARRADFVFRGSPHWVFYCPLHASARRARGAQPASHLREWTEQVEEGAELVPCEACGVSDIGYRQLECDACGRGFHMRCLEPPMDAIPPGAWLCPDCRARPVASPGAAP